MKKKIISLLSAFVMILGTVLPATQSVYAAGSDIVAEPYISATGEATCGTDGVSTTYKGVWKASIPMAIAMESVANKIPSTGYPHGKDGKNKIAYVEYRVTFPKGAKIIEDDKDEIKTSSNSAMFNGNGIEFLRPETNIVTFKIPLMDVDLPSLKANYEKDKKDNPETKTVDLSIPYTLTANTLEEAKEFEAGKITSTGEIEIHPSGSLWKFYKVIYSTDKATVSLATGLSECFAPVPAEKVTVTFELGDGVEFADANFVNTPVEIEKGQMLTEAQLPKVKAKEGYTLVEGWSIQPTGAKFDIANPISDSMTLRATATKNAPQEQEFKVEIPLEGDILIGDETEHDKVFESTKDASHEFVGTLNVKPIKDKLAEIEGQYQSAAQNPDGIAVSELDFSMVATFTLPEQMEFNPAEVKATLTEANDKFEITETKTEGKKVTVTMKLKGTDFDTFAKVKAAVTGAGDLLKVTLSGAKFTDSAKVNTNYTVHGIVGGNFTAKAEYNNNPIKFNIVFVGEQSATGKDAILASEPNNTNIQFTLKYYEKEDSHSSGHGGSTSDKTIKKEVALNKEDHYQYLIGYKDQTFRPNDNMTREEVTVMFSRLLANRPIKGMVYSYNLSDISTDRWSVTAISYLNELKIIEGYVDGTFKPKKSITRAEFAAIASRFANLQTGDKSFSDVMTSHWAYDSIRKAAAAGWISGYADGTFKPDQPITRAEVVSIVNRMLNRYADAEFVEKNKNEILYFSDIHNSHWAYYPIVEATNGHDYTRKANGIDELWSEVNGKSFVYDK